MTLYELSQSSIPRVFFSFVCLVMLSSMHCYPCILVNVCVDFQAEFFFNYNKVQRAKFYSNTLL